MRIAKENNVPTPILSTIYPLLKLVQFRLKEEKKMFEIDKNDFQGNSDDYQRIFSEKYITKH